MRVVFFETTQADCLDEVLADRTPLVSGLVSNLQSELDIFPDIAPGEKPIVLKNHAAVLARTFNELSFLTHFAVVRLDEPGDDAKQGRFSATTWADKTNELIFGDVQAHVVQNQQLLVGLLRVFNEDLRQICDFQHAGYLPVNNVAVIARAVTFATYQAVAAFEARALGRACSKSA
jgi:hypothetical protein